MIVNSMQRAGEAAVETTMQGIVEILQDSVPLMYHISALLHNKEWTGVLEASIHHKKVMQTEKEEASSSGGKPDKPWPLRVGLKKFAHLVRIDFQGEG